MVEVELSRPLTSINGLNCYGALKMLVRLQGEPLGIVNLPVVEGQCTSSAMAQAIADQLNGTLQAHWLAKQWRSELECGASLYGEVHLHHDPSRTDPSLPLVTVAVCTRNRADDLALCFDALAKLDYPRLEILIIDNAPGDETTKRLVAERYPRLRYIREQRPGLNWARNRALAAARGDIIAFTDDDVIVDTGWAHALAEVFAASPEVMAVTGLVVPYELETEAQVFFERFNGFTKGFQRRRFFLDRDRGKKEKFHLHPGSFGTGANMAYRRSLFEKIGSFDPALDVGTPTNGGGDLEMFFRVIQEGYTLVYEPKALVWHRHRRGFSALKKQLHGWGSGNLAFLLRSARAYSNMRLEILRYVVKWIWEANIRRLQKNTIRPAGIPNELILAQLSGALVGAWRYFQACRQARKITKTFGVLPPAVTAEKGAGDKI